jgi:hypothetical protein
VGEQRTHIWKRRQKVKKKLEGTMVLSIDSSFLAMINCTLLQNILGDILEELAYCI